MSALQDVAMNMANSTEMLADDVQPGALGLALTAARAVAKAAHAASALAWAARCLDEARALRTAEELSKVTVCGLELAASRRVPAKLSAKRSAARTRRGGRKTKHADASSDSGSAATIASPSGSALDTGLFDLFGEAATMDKGVDSADAAAGKKHTAQSYSMCDSSLDEASIAQVRLSASALEGIAESTARISFVGTWLKRSPDSLDFVEDERINTVPDTSPDRTPVESPIECLEEIPISWSSTLLCGDDPDGVADAVDSSLEGQGRNSQYVAGASEGRNVTATGELSGGRHGMGIVGGRELGALCAGNLELVEGGAIGGHGGKTWPVVVASGETEIFQTDVGNSGNSDLRDGGKLDGANDCKSSGSGASASGVNVVS